MQIESDQHHGIGLAGALTIFSANQYSSRLSCQGSRYFRNVTKGAAAEPVYARWNRREFQGQLPYHTVQQRRRQLGLSIRTLSK